MSTVRIIAQLTAKPGKEAEVYAALQSLAAVSRTEPGCRQYIPYAADSSGRFYVDEIYDDAAAVDAHMESAHFKAAAAGFPDLLDGAPVIDFVRPVEI